MRTLFAPISLCCTTVAICGAAQFGRFREDPTAAAVQTAATAQAAASVTETLSHVPVIDRDPSGLYPLLVMQVEITPEPEEAEGKAIRAAIAAEEAEQPAASEWAAALLPARNDEEPEP